MIIELKRSDQSARSAIHELCKYVALFKTQHGLPLYRLRCFLVSTHWRELRVPFAEFVRAADVQVEGFVLSVAEDGMPTGASRPVLPDPSEPVTFFVHHDILLYDNAARRDAAAVPVADALLASGATAGFVCRLTSSASPEELPYPYALYSVVGGIEPNVRSEIEAQLRVEQEVDEEELEASGPIPAHVVQQDFSRRLHELPAWLSDTCEIGYPDKLAAMLRTEWRCEEIQRRGRMLSEAAISDDELLHALQGLDGANTMIYQRVACPRIEQGWLEFVDGARKCLRGNPKWERDFDLFSRLVAEHSAAASVSANIYNPLRTPMSLSKLIFEGDASYLPAMEIVCSGADDESVILVSTLIWRGPSPVRSLEELLDGIADTGFDYNLMCHFDQGWTVDRELTSRLGLDYQSVVLKPLRVGGYATFEMTDTRGSVSLVPFAPHPVSSLADYTRLHREELIGVLGELATASGVR